MMKKIRAYYFSAYYDKQEVMIYDVDTTEEALKIIKKLENEKLKDKEIRYTVRGIQEYDFEAQEWKELYDKNNPNTEIRKDKTPLYSAIFKG